jgi:acyl transferase domain-containing protein/SAM-dependent methyltransferase
LDNRVQSEADSQALSPAKRALYELRSARARVEELESARTEPIAIVGMGLRFPGGASDPESLWRVLEEGRDTITEIPASRWDIDEFFDADPDAPGRMYTRYGAFLDNVDEFDARFFGVSPREAAAMDPQQRLLLEVAWEALENAGETADHVRGDAGVFVALSNSDYGRMVMSRRDEIDVYSSTGSNFSVAAGRLSYFLGLDGPSMVVDSACSGSLVAIHLACQSLRAGECRTAMAGGANLILSPEININFSKARMMATDGRCKTFDASADGYVRGEGCGIVVLKRLSHAIADGNRVMAVIRGSAVNQDGHSGGLTVPNGPAQEAVIRRALASAKLDPADVDYVEAHGTGTSLGDPIEAHALAAVFGPERDAANPLVVGSLKTNVGHLESAAGVAGLIKAVLALQHETIPAHLHFREMNPHIDWGGMPVEIPTSTREWRRGARPRVAGVSSFGFSGTNAHVLVGEAPAAVASDERSSATKRTSHLLVLSARTPAALDRTIQNYRELLAQPGPDLADICFSANVGRAHFQERVVFQAGSREAMLAALNTTPIARGSSESIPEVAFLFTGQGSQWLGMGRELYESEPVFRAAMDECARILDDRLATPLLEVIYGESSALLDETQYTQPALFALQWSLAQLWKSWGVEPTVVLGHSVGEYVALCVAGAWSLEDGLTIIAERGRLTQALASGWSMSVVQCSLAQVEEAMRSESVGNRVSVAAVNTPDNIVMSGRDAELEKVEARLRASGILVTRLRVSHGFHSAQMDEVAGKFANFVTTFPMHPPRVAVISSVTGRAASFEELRAADYWTRQVRHAVLFQQAITALAATGAGVFLEVGPAPVLTGMGRQCIGDAGSWVASMRRDHNAFETMVMGLAELYVQGVSVNWSQFEDGSRLRVALPTYPFERQRYWIEDAVRTESAPVWETVRESAAWQADQGRLDLSVDRYAHGWPILERLTDAYLTAALAGLGAFKTPGESQSVESLIDQTGIQVSFGKLLGRWLGRLVDAGVLRKSGDMYVAESEIIAPMIAPLLQEADVIFGSDRIILDYVVSCGSQLIEYVTGARSTLETLFPGGSFKRAEDLYEHAPLSAYFGGIGRAAMEALVRARGGSPIRAIEIGAGTGATTSALLPVVPANGSAYYFTDLSDFFLNHGRNKFARYGFMRYGRFDAEESGDEQGYAAGSFDVVVATNVLHATRDIRGTLQGVRSLLAPGGILLLCEVTTYLPWFDITTALIEGWQLFEDGLRGDHPLLPAEQWTKLLDEAGFEQVAAFPEAGSAAEVLGQHVILAQVPGRAVHRSRREMSSVVSRNAPDQSATSSLDDIRAQLDAAPASERNEILVALIRGQLAQSLRVADPESLERKRRLIEFGIDSLMAVELRNRLASVLKLQAPLPATLIFEHPSIDALAEYLELDVLGYGESVPTVSTKPTIDANAERVAELEDISEEEAEALLLRRLQSL